MILVSVGEQNAANAVFVHFQVGDVGDDQVDAGHVFLGESQAAVDDDHVVVIFHHRHVLADLAQSAKGNDADLA